MASWNVTPQDDVEVLGNGKYKFPENTTTQDKTYTITYKPIDDGSCLFTTTYTVPGVEAEKYCTYTVKTNIVFARVTFTINGEDEQIKYADQNGEATLVVSYTGEPPVVTASLYNRNVTFEDNGKTVPCGGSVTINGTIEKDITFVAQVGHGNVVFASFSGTIRIYDANNNSMSFTDLQTGTLVNYITFGLRNEGGSAAVTSYTTTIRVRFKPTSMDNTYKAKFTIDSSQGSAINIPTTDPDYYSNRRFKCALMQTTYWINSTNNNHFGCGDYFTAPLDKLMYSESQTETVVFDFDGSSDLGCRSLPCYN